MAAHLLGKSFLKTLGDIWFSQHHTALTKVIFGLTKDDTATYYPDINSFLSYHIFYFKTWVTPS
jgi:hypothetical protein